VFTSEGTIASTRVPSNITFLTGTDAAPTVMTTALTLDSAQKATFPGRVIGSVNGALSAPGLTFTGTWVTGGSATTTKPYVLIETAGATSTSWSTSGTGFGLNAATGFGGFLMDLQVNGSSKVTVDSTGTLNAVLLASTGNVRAASTGQIFWNTRTKLTSGADGVLTMTNTAANGFTRVSIGSDTSSFPALCPSGTAVLDVRVAGACTTYANVNVLDLGVRHPIGTGTAPTIASGFGSSPSIAGTDAGGRVTVGTGGVAATGAVTFGTAWATAPACVVNNETTQLVAFATATTTTLTIASATPFGAADKLTWNCIGY
jgi:hypothetical protein